MYLFDLDGTLIDSNGIWKDVDREFLARRGLPYTRAYYEGVAHTIFPLAAKFTKEFCHLPESEEAIMAEWMELAKDAYAHVTVKPGVRAFLKQCRMENRRMALVTSSVPVHCRTAMEKLGLMKYFESVTEIRGGGIPVQPEFPFLKIGRQPPPCRAAAAQGRLIHIAEHSLALPLRYGRHRLQAQLLGLMCSPPDAKENHARHRQRQQQTHPAQLIGWTSCPQIDPNSHNGADKL